jgi:ATP-dependent Zn protease
VNISSNTSNTFYFDDLRANAIFVRINNKDDLPLKIKSVETEQLNLYLICKLSGSEKYHLSFGNKAITSPEYDIKYFSDQIPAELKILNTCEITSTGKADSKKPSGIFLDKKFIWVAIILVILLLVFMINHMLRDMRNKQMNDKKGS